MYYLYPSGYLIYFDMLEVQIKALKAGLIGALRRGQAAEIVIKQLSTNIDKAHISAS